MTARETDSIVEGLTPIMKIDDHLEIHPRQPEDAEELFALTDANRNYLRLWLPWLDHCTSPDDTRKNILTSLEEADHGVSLAVCIWHEGCIVGVTGFNSISKVNRIGHIGYAPRRDSLRSLRRQRLKKNLRTHAEGQLPRGPAVETRHEEGRKIDLSHRGSQAERGNNREENDANQDR